MQMYVKMDLYFLTPKNVVEVFLREITAIMQVACVRVYSARRVSDCNSLQMWYVWKSTRKKSWRCFTLKVAKASDSCDLNLKATIHDVDLVYISLDSLFSLLHPFNCLLEKRIRDNRSIF